MKTKHSAIVIIQISILVISIIAFSNIIAAATSAPIPTNVGAKKIIIYQNSTNNNESFRAKITGAYLPGTIPVIYNGVTWVKNLLNIGPISLDWGSILTSGYAFVIYVAAATFIIAAIIGASTGQSWENTFYWTKLTTVAASAAVLTGNIAAALFVSGPVGWVVGGVAAVVIFLLTGVRADQRAIVFNSALWQPKLGGSDCTQCNGKEFPCTMYQCKSLGQGCVLKNEGDNARCVDGSPGDTSAPVIKARTDSLQPDYSYEPISGVINGVEIKYNDEDLPAFKIFTFGIELTDSSGNEKVGTCKIADHRTANWGAMGNLPFGEGLWEENHTQMMKFSGLANLQKEGIELPSGGNYEYYIRCQNVNGYANDAEFLFKFKVDPFPDHTQPTIYGFNFFLNPAPIRYFVADEPHEARAVVYTDEPATCKWDKNDVTYENMQNSMESCSSSVTNFNAQMSYTCSGTLTGLENGKNNKFHFRCSDTSGNINTQSKTLTLTGSRPLVIDSASPDGTTVKGSSDFVTVTLQATTSAGYGNGLAYCSYSTTGTYDDYTKFINTNAHTHSSDLSLAPESYTYYIQCFDGAGNSDTKTINFNVESDSQPPVVLRAYYQSPNINIITDEKAECVYDTTDCSYNFADGIKMSTTDNLNHVAEWDNKNTFYIRCKDDYGTEPLPGTSSCSIIIKPLSL